MKHPFDLPLTAEYALPPEPEGRTVLCDAVLREIAVCDTQEDCEELVAIVNAYDDLVAALKEIVEARIGYDITVNKSTPILTFEKLADAHDLQDIARKALGKV